MAALVNLALVQQCFFDDNDKKQRTLVYLSNSSSRRMAMNEGKAHGQPSWRQNKRQENGESQYTSGKEGRLRRLGAPEQAMQRIGGCGRGEGLPERAGRAFESLQGGPEEQVGCVQVRIRRR